MRKIQELIFKCSAQKVLKNKRIKTKFVTYEQSKSILLLYKLVDESVEFSVQKIINELKKDGKIVDVCFFSDKNKTITFRSQNYFAEDKISWLGKPAKETINALRNHTFDLVLDLTTEPSLPLQYILMNAEAYCKSGFKHNDFSDLNFVVSLPNSDKNNNESVSYYIKTIFETVIYYLKQIKSND